MSRAHRWLLLSALLAAFVARAPGILWGYNFPFGWHGHHVDEYVHTQVTHKLLYPAIKLDWEHPYPMGMAAHVAVPLKLKQVMLREPKPAPNQRPPEPAQRAAMLLTGRTVAVLYGMLCVLVTFSLSRKLFTDIRVALLAAWILALTGLHVTQSHFFLADSSALFWTLLGTLLLWRELAENEAGSPHWLALAAACFGVAFGLKIAVASLPSLALVVLWRSPRLWRALYSGVFFFTGAMLVNLTMFSLKDLARVFAGGINDPYIKSVFDNLRLYTLEMPSIVSLPLFALAMAGTVSLARKYWSQTEFGRQMHIAVVILLPLATHIFFLLFKLDHFPRHVYPLLPWVAVAAAWAMWQLMRSMKERGLAPALLVVPVFIYLALFVYDGERVFLREPRNEAAKWLAANVAPGTTYYWRNHVALPGYKHIAFHDGDGRPEVLVWEMYRVNPVLSGMGWRDSYPRDYRYIFEARNQAYVDRIQQVFKNETEYKQVARFDEGYFMPELKWTDRLIGNRSRNYVTEIIIYRRPPTPADQQPATTTEAVNTK